MSLSSLVISIISLIVAMTVTWHAYFKPAKIVGSFSYIILWQFKSESDGHVMDRKLTPSFWLGNVGALPILIEDLRLLFITESGKKVEAYPVNYVPLEAIEGPNNFNEYGRLSSGGPFRGFALASNERWISTYNYSLPQNIYSELKGDIKVSVQIKTKGTENWNTVMEDILVFGEKPMHIQLQDIKGGGVESIPIYTKRWQKRTKSNL